MAGRDSQAHLERLRAELRDARKQAGFTQKEVARAMDWSASKMLRIEAGSVGISTTDLRALLAYYAIRDQRRTEELVSLVRGNR
ncbi:MAG: helix-turn-helix transcriptional regulator [Actinobacteria bacterium]|nr:helix-turn-helix transcriptional regulator [Actinomycetota bacterium]MBI3687308.1 helix-turn-helix transcriptional regulator [Actinomycetota bacterium]